MRRFWVGRVRELARAYYRVQQQLTWHMPQKPGRPMISLRRVRILKHGRNQTIRIPREMELAASEATIRREGDSLIIEPVEKRSLLDLLATWDPLDIDLPE